MGMTIDTTEFDKIFFKLVENKIPAEAGKALFKGGAELLRDAIKVPPMAPKDIGDLWGAAGIQGDGTQIHKVSEGVPPGFQAHVSKESVSVAPGFNIEYAARWHEVSPTKKINWTTHKGAPQPGPKYLEIKMSMFKRKYMEIVALAISNILKRKGG